ncbi:MAG: lysine methyltransferase [Isosphaeraceae bacterium]
MSEEVATSYDQIPYESRYVGATHPDRIASMAVLHGMNPPPVGSSRVLELGCSDGGNLLTLAQSLPLASFLGVDLSARQVSQGQEAARALSIGNVEFRALSLSEVDESFGQFDYILCHGVYSWVSASLRDKILEICARCLAPNGVAYVSYNTYPGWHQRGVVREMMLYHTRGIADPATRVREARALLEFLTWAAVPGDGPYAHVLRHEAEQLSKRRDTYVFHEHLEEENHPFYFHEFVAHAEKAGLRYLAKSHFNLQEANLPPEVSKVLGQLGSDRVRREQYLDFVMNRTFRQSLLCHADVATNDGPTPGFVPGLKVAALARPESTKPDIRSDSPEPFLSLYGDKLTVGKPLLKAALVALQQRWPRSSGFDELHADVLSRLGRTGLEEGSDPSTFASYLLQGHLANLVSFHTEDPPLASEPGDLPRAPSIARRDAALGARVVGLRGAFAVLQDIDRLILPLLDGTRDRAAVVDELASYTSDGRLQMHREGRAITDPAAVRALLSTSVEDSLVRLAGEALLLAD